MAIKLPDSLINSRYEIDVIVPELKVFSKSGENGSFSLSVGYDADAISKMCKQVARDMYEQIDKEIIEELLELNGYVKKRTCCYVWDEKQHAWVCDQCGGIEPCSNDVNYCCDCGAEVVG